MGAVEEMMCVVCVDVTEESPFSFNRSRKVNNNSRRSASYLSVNLLQNGKLGLYDWGRAVDTVCTAVCQTTVTSPPRPCDSSTACRLCRLEPKIYLFNRCIKTSILFTCDPFYCIQDLLLTCLICILILYNYVTHFV